MNTRISIARNSIFLLAARATPKMFWAVIFALIARFLGAQELGIYVLGITLPAMLLPIVNLGMTQILIREVAKARELAPKYLGNFTVLRLLSSLVAFGLLWVIVYALRYPPRTAWVVMVMGSVMMPRAVANLFYDFFNSLEVSHYITYSEIPSELFKFVVGATLLLGGWGLEAQALIYLLSGVMRLLLAGLLVVRLIGFPKWELDLGFCKPLLAVALSFLAIEVFQSVDYRIDTVLLSKLQEESAVGFYGAVVTMLQVLLLIPYAFQYAIFPVMSRLYMNARSSAEEIYQKASHYLFLATVPIAVGTTVLADRLLVLIYGADFSEAALALRIIIWSLVFFSLNIPPSILVIVANKQGAYLVFAAVTLTINIALNLILIPRINYLGAAVAALCSRTLFLGCNYAFVYRNLSTASVLRFFPKPLLASLLMGGLAYFLRSTNLILAIASSGIFYAVLLIVMGVLSGEEISLGKSIIRGVFDRSWLHKGADTLR